MVEYDLDIFSSALGYKNPTEMVLKLFIPITVGSIILFFALIILDIFPLFICIMILVFTLSLNVLIPLIIVEKKKRDINENLHFFITYAGTISTMEISRALLFRKLAQKEVFGEISKVCQKVNYLAKSWNLGFAITLRKISKLVPSQPLADFFDRFAVMMDFGEDLHTFLKEEQDSVLEDFELEYKKSLEVVRTLQDIFMSVIITMAFGMAIGLMLPLIMGVPMSTVINWALFSVLIIDIMMMVLTKAFIPSDKILCNLEVKSVEYKRLQLYFWIFLSVSILIFAILFSFTSFNLLIVAAFSSIPLAIFGYMAGKYEEKVMRRDNIFPTFIRSYGSAIAIRNGATISSLYSLRIHDFGLLNDMVIALYKRLRIGSDKFKCWYYFAAESGSHLIFHFSKIFSETIYLGGQPIATAEIVSTNFMRLLSLRKLRLQLASGLRATLFGSLVGFAATAFTTVEIVEMLSKLFAEPMKNTQGQDFSLASIMGNTANLSSLTMDTAQIVFYLSIIIIIHSLISSLIIKMVDGGTYYAAFFDFCIMLFIGAAISYFTPIVINNLLPDISGTVNATSPSGP